MTDRSSPVSDEYRYARELLVSFVNEHCDPVPEWKPNDDLMGILSQFDNALTVVRSIKAGFDPKRSSAGIAELASQIEARADLFLERGHPAYNLLGDELHQIAESVRALSGDVAQPSLATSEMVKAAYAAYNDDEVLKRAEDWLEEVINAALRASSPSSTQGEPGK